MQTVDSNMAILSQAEASIAAIECVLTIVECCLILQPQHDQDVSAE